VKRIRPHIFWPVFIVSIFMVSVVFMGILLSLATGDPNLEVEPDYYARAMSWDDRKALLAESEQLGWQAQFSHHEDELHIIVRDSTGSPVGDSIRATVFHNAMRADAETFERTAAEAGTFTLPLASPKAGWWNVAIEVTSGEALYIEDARLQIGKDG
jgi:nitrogen fixation protein FixH